MSLRWESSFYHSWDVLKNMDILSAPKKTKFITKEDKEYTEENKSLKKDEKEQIVQESQNNKNNYLENINFSFNFMRNTFVIVDMSENAILVDFKPNRLKYIFYKLKKFIKDYFAYNYISSMTIIITHNCTSEILSPFSRNPDEIINNIDSKIFGNGEKKNAISQFIPGGYFSLYNSLEAIKEFSSSKTIDNIKHDILIINNSLLTYDNTIRNDSFYYFKDKYEINVISLELPFEGLKELAINSGGKLLQINKDNKNINYYNTTGDMDEFLFYYACKYTHIKNERIVIVKPIKQIDYKMDAHELRFICFCHKKYQKIIYSCPECGHPYCYIPFYCIKCNLLNIDNTFLQLLLRAKNDKDNKDNNKCFPYKFSCYYQQYLNYDYYIKNAENALSKLKVYEKEFKRITDIRDFDKISYDICPFGFQFKLLYYYIKFEKSRQNFYRDLKKNVFEENYAEYVENKKALFLKDNIRCSGCNNIFEVKDETDLDDIIIFSNCLDLFCSECYKYLINNNIGCLECND